MTVKVEGFQWKMTNKIREKINGNFFEIIIDDEDEEIQPFEQNEYKSPGHELFKPNKIMQHKCDRHRLNRN